jgi:sulfate adenylyltransferase subunit 1
VPATIVSLDARFDEQNVSTIEDPDSLRLNHIGRVTLQASEPLPIDRYTTSRSTGSFLLIDPSDGATLAAGLIGTPLAVLDREPAVASRRATAPKREPL